MRHIICITALLVTSQLALANEEEVNEFAKRYDRVGSVYAPACAKEYRPGSDEFTACIEQRYCADYPNHAACKEVGHDS